ncbi:ComF family protein [Ancylomarina sp. 16SWW S1-10-2]|uniref:ComF family protein n=1 Tax=Ancylomarina sp. 16SWW S1-10-2 TaxID=2499681 RepID=UPI001E30007B|nr:phosphoribosyltransferase family protein [Ancylomarina sp. 16SWW S1-10-2]
MKGEKVICTSCLFQLPKTNFHFQKDNPISEIFIGRVNITNATAFFTFNKGSRYQKLIHKLKYNRQAEIGIELGKHFGNTLMNSEYYRDIDVIIPVPLHPKKKKARTYNQAEMIAKGMAETMNIEMIVDVLVRNIHSESQTKKDKIERWLNVENIFALKSSEKLKNKHVLLVDDVITTGATLEACAQKLLEIDHIKVSIACLAQA